MKKIEIYVTDTEYNDLVSKIQKYQKNVMEHQDDGRYSDQERAEIINAFGAIPFYAKEGLKKEITEIDEYNKKYSFKSEAEKNSNWKQSKERKPFPNNQRPVHETKPLITNDRVDPEKTDLDVEKQLSVDEITIPENIQYETQTESGSDFDFNL